MPYFAAAYCGARALPRTITVEPMLTSTSSRPKWSHTASAIALICAQSVMSACTRNALRPAASTRAAVRRAHRHLRTVAGARAGEEDSLSGKALRERHDVRGPY
jgi:hypothetical protein